MPKKEKKKKKSWKERQRERQIAQQRAQEAREMQREIEAARKPRKWPKGKILGAVCSVILIFGAYSAWQYVILEEPSPSIPTGGTIYIRADGSIEPLTANITSADNVTYTFTGNNYDSLVIERDNVLVDGAGYTLQGTGNGTGINLTGRSNVAITNTKIKDFDFGVYLNSTSDNVLSQNNLADNYCGIWLMYSSDNTISGNNITENNVNGIWLDYSSNNVISENTFFNCGPSVWKSYLNVVVDNLVNGKPLVYLEGVSDYAVDNAGQVILVNCINILVENLSLSSASIGIQLLATNDTHITNNNITNNRWYGIHLYSSSDNTISGNNMSNNNDGISLSKSSNNTISGNNITDSQCGIELHESSNNCNYHNNFIDNAEQVDIDGSANIWDDGYPSGGNYWSDYEERYPGADELDGSGVWNTPYVIDVNNQDNYPVMNL